LLKLDLIYLCKGQRYDVIINANQTVGNYWLRVATGGGVCDGPNSNANNIRSIIRYSGAPAQNPNSTGSVPSGCSDATNIVPYVQSTVPSGTPTDLSVGFNPIGPNGAILVRWTINGSSIQVDWQNPTLEYVINGTSNFPTSENIYSIGPANVVSLMHFDVTLTVLTVCAVDVLGYHLQYSRSCITASYSSSRPQVFCSGLWNWYL
jgi:hypothetical protein